MGTTSRVLTLTALAAAAGAVAWTVRDLRTQFGGVATGERAERVLRSPQFRDGKFHNTVPAAVIERGMRDTFRELIFGKQRRRPVGRIPVVSPPADAPALSPDGLHITWFGHSTALAEIEGKRVLFDPVWSERCSPSRLVGPRRLHPMPLPADRLAQVDAILISHDHYDHLDLATVRTLTRTQSAPFLVPLGVGAHLDRWGVPAERIIELDWDESVDIAGLHFVATAARHFSGRKFTRDGTLWASWAVRGERRSIFYTGDSGYWDGYREIGERYGPFDVSLVQIGAYNFAWPDIHMTPEDGAKAHVDVRGGLLIPLHWCTFNLALHSWSEPVERVWAEAKARDITLAVPRPGERIDVDEPPAVEAWWQPIA